MGRIKTAVWNFVGADDGMVGCWCLLAAIFVLMGFSMWFITP